MKKFALIGAAGFVAPRHIQAIKDVGGDLVAALDPHDSVGRLDQHFPGCEFFTSPERFERHLLKHPVDYVSICSPNYLHDSHCLMALRSGADAICEKPLVCNERNLDTLAEWEVSTGKRVNVVLQCRLHPGAVAAEKELNAKWYNVKVDYHTPRGAWYLQSWKGDVTKSGGLPTNIGIHLFDLCIWLFGMPDMQSVCGSVSDRRAHGEFDLEQAAVNWNLSISGTEPRREFLVEGSLSIDLSGGFTDLHTRMYDLVLMGRGYGVEDIRPATKLVEAIRRCQ